MADPATPIRRTGGDTGHLTPHSKSRDSGDGFVTLPDGTRRWGRFGAAGVLLRHTNDLGEVSYFVALRAPEIHLGGTWGIPGGALNRTETPLEGALREFAEEIGHVLADYLVAAVTEDARGTWSYWTHLLDVAERFVPPDEFTWETADARWVSADELSELDLFDAFRETLLRLGVL